MIGDQPTKLTDRLLHDPVGNTLAIIVLLGMVLMVGRSSIIFPRLTPIPTPAWRDWAFPFLALVGFGVAAYLAYVEISQVAAVCGPVGDCNTVQQSAYARLFGVCQLAYWVCWDTLPTPERDFTYIDDIVNGIIRIINKAPSPQYSTITTATAPYKDYIGTISARHFAPFYYCH